MKLEFSLQFFSKNTQILNFTKISPVGTELFHADGRKGRHDESNNPVLQFCEMRLKHFSVWYQVLLKYVLLIMNK